MTELSQPMSAFGGTGRSREMPEWTFKAYSVAEIGATDSQINVRFRHKADVRFWG
jgi:hypothetical protein